MEWISVNDRLPEDKLGQRVFVHNGIPYAAWFSNGDFYFNLSDKNENYPMKYVTHWMELPEPPKN